MGFNHFQAPTAVDMASMFIKLVKNLKPWMDVTTACVQNKGCNVQLDRAQRMVSVRQLISLNMNAYTKYSLQWFLLFYVLVFKICCAVGALCMLS